MNTLHLHPGEHITWCTWTGAPVTARVERVDAFGFSYVTQGPHAHAVREDHHVWRGLRATA